MINKNGRIINRKFTVNNMGPDNCKSSDSKPVTGTVNKTDKKTVTNIIIMTIILNAIIKYLNFNLNSPKITNCRNDKIKILLRQRWTAGLFKAWGI